MEIHPGFLETGTAAQLSFVSAIIFILTHIIEIRELEEISKAPNFQLVSLKISPVVINKIASVKLLKLNVDPIIVPNMIIESWRF